jgi:hypothetical protein
MGSLDVFLTRIGTMNLAHAASPSPPLEERAGERRPFVYLRRTLHGKEAWLEENGAIPCCKWCKPWQPATLPALPKTFARHSLHWFALTFIVCS